MGFFGKGGFACAFEVQDPWETQLTCKVITKTLLKTKKVKTKVSIISLHMDWKLFHVLDSFGQKLRFIVLSNILALFTFTTTLRMVTMCIWPLNYVYSALSWTCSNTNTNLQNWKFASLWFNSLDYVTTCTHIKLSIKIWSLEIYFLISIWISRLWISAWLCWSRI